MTAPSALPVPSSAGTPNSVKRLLVANGPGANVDPLAFERFCAEWARLLGVAISATSCDSAEELAGVLESASSFDGVVLNASGCDRIEVVEATVAACGVPAVSVDLATTSLPARPVRGCVAHIRGRAIDGYLWALRHVRHRARWPFETLAYGDQDDQVGDLRLPARPGVPPVVVLVHGGGWKEQWQRDLMDGAAIDLCERGYATWNLEFRRVGSKGGGWPGTLEDVAAGLDALAEFGRKHSLDLSRVVVLGHSSGAQLALWAAAQAVRQPDPRVGLVAAVSLAGLLDLFESARRGLIGGENAVARLLGGLPAEVPDRYAAASPTHLLPIGVPQILVQGLRDYIPDLIDLNRSYAEKARLAGDVVELLELPDADHLGVIEAASPAWRRAAEMLEAAVPPGPGRKT